MISISYKVKFYLKYSVKMPNVKYITFIDKFQLNLYNENV